MKLFLALLLLVGGYYLALCQMTDRAMAQLTGLYDQYSSVSATADRWAEGDTSAHFAPSR